MPVVIQSYQNYRIVCITKIFVSSLDLCLILATSTIPCLQKSVNCVGLLVGNMLCLGENCFRLPCHTSRNLLKILLRNTQTIEGADIMTTISWSEKVRDKLENIYCY